MNAAGQRVLHVLDERTESVSLNSLDLDLSDASTFMFKSWIVSTEASFLVARLRFPRNCTR